MTVNHDRDEPRRIGESLELAERLPAGPVRDALVEACRTAGWHALMTAGQHLHEVREAIRAGRWADVVYGYERAAAAASEARPAVPLLDEETRRLRPR